MSDTTVPAPPPRWSSAVLFLVAAFFLRLAFGLASDFWTDDEKQIYLIGLRYFTTGEWPYFGPDVVYTGTQIPGALQGVLVGGPLFLVAMPEAPYVLLNALSLGALSLLAWYIGCRCPSVPRWIVWTWILFAPWTLNFSTHVVNPSYVLTGAVLFFVGVFELLPSLRLGVVPERVAFLCVGFGVQWVAQLHLSFLLLLPFLLAVFVIAIRSDWRAAIRGAVWCALGALLAGATLVPTLVQFGPAALARETGAGMALDWTNLMRLPHVVARFLSFGSFEVPRFIGSGSEARLAFLVRYWWAAPFVVFTTLCGLFQAVVLFVAFFRRTGPRDWRAVRTFTLATLALLYTSFAFSVKDPASHTFYVILPVVMIYSFYCWTPLVARRAGRVVAASLLAAGFVTHLAIAVDGFRERSLYANRALVVRAIEEKDYRLVGERRPEISRSGQGR